MILELIIGLKLKFTNGTFTMVIEVKVVGSAYQLTRDVPGKTDLVETIPDLVATDGSTFELRVDCTEERSEIFFNGVLWQIEYSSHAQGYIPSYEKFEMERVGSKNGFLSLQYTEGNTK